MTDNSKVGGALLGAGAALAALFAAGKLKAAEGETPQDVIQQVQAAEAAGTGSGSLQAAISSLAAAVLGKNPNTFTTFRVPCPVAGTAYQLPDRRIPHKMALVIKALPTNAGLIYVAASLPDAINANSTYLLIANELVELEISNANKVYISATAAGEGVACVVEQEA